MTTSSTTPAAPATTNPVTAAEQTVVTDVKADVVKAESWLKHFWYQFLIGAAVGAFVAHIVWK